MAKPGPKGISKKIKARLRKAFLNGMGYREAAKYAGCGISTAKRHGKDMEFKCSCGQPRSAHMGWCKEKFRKSLRRQAFMAIWLKPYQIKPGSNRPPKLPPELAIKPKRA